MTLWGWDASHYDGTLTPTILARAKSEGIAFFTHKLAEGISDTEGTHDDTALAAARSAGIEFLGGYVVPRTLDSAAQVDYWWQVLNNSEPWWKDFPGWFNQIDLERWSYDPVSAAKGVDCAKRWRDKTGRQTLLYASHSQYGDQLAAWDGPLWNADYVSTAAGSPSAMYPGDGWTPLHGTWRGGWTPYSGKAPTILQFTSSATIAGLTTCDANAFRGSVDELRALITGSTEMAQLDRIEKMLVTLVENDNTLGPDGNHVGIYWVNPNNPADKEYCAAGNGVKQELDEIRAKAGAPSDAQIAAMAAAVADRLIASNANGLTAADHAGVVDDVTKALAAAAQAQATALAQAQTA